MDNEGGTGGWEAWWTVRVELGGGRYGGQLGWNWRVAGMVDSEGGTGGWEVWCTVRVELGGRTSPFSTMDANTYLRHIRNCLCQY